MFTFSLEYTRNHVHYIKVSSLRIVGQKSNGDWIEDDETTQFISVDSDSLEYELMDSNFPEALLDVLYSEFDQWLDYWYNKL